MVRTPPQNNAYNVIHIRFAIFLQLLIYAVTNVAS